MIYIFTKEFNNSICKIIDWFNYYKLNFQRINDYIENFNELDYFLDFNQTKEDFFLIYQPYTKFDSRFGLTIKNQLILEYIQSFFKSEENKIGQILTYDLDSKFTVLREAKNLNIKIPNTIVTNNLKRLKKFFEENDTIITKPSHEIFDLYYGNKHFKPYTEEITKEQLDTYPEVFGISMFQKKIEKLCDIKTFYLDGSFYSQAIFSQKNINSKVDFRKFNNTSPWRTTPFKLPNNVEKKIELLLKKKKLKMAVVDFILDLDYNIYFLEINPDGVFDSISNQCNYYLEKKISEYIYEKHIE